MGLPPEIVYLNTGFTGDIPCDILFDYKFIITYFKILNS